MWRPRWYLEHKPCRGSHHESLESPNQDQHEINQPLCWLQKKLPGVLPFRPPNCLTNTWTAFPAQLLFTVYTPFALRLFFFFCGRKPNHLENGTTYPSAPREQAVGCKHDLNCGGGNSGIVWTKMEPIANFPFYFVVSQLSHESLVVFGLLWFFFFFFAPASCSQLSEVQDPLRHCQFVVFPPCIFFFALLCGSRLGFNTLDFSSSSFSPLWFVCFAPLSAE